MLIGVLRPIELRSVLERRTDSLLTLTHGYLTVAGREKFNLDQPMGIAGSFLWLPLGFPTAQQ